MSPKVCFSLDVPTLVMSTLCASGSPAIERDFFCFWLGSSAFQVTDDALRPSNIRGDGLCPVLLETVEQLSEEQASGAVLGFRKRFKLVPETLDRLIFCHVQVTIGEGNGDEFQGLLGFLLVVLWALESVSSLSQRPLTG